MTKETQWQNLNNFHAEVELIETQKESYIRTWNMVIKAASK